MTDTIFQRLAATGTNLARDFFGQPQAAEECDLGRAAMLDAVLAGDDPATVLALARAADVQRGAEPDQSRGAMAAMLHCLDALQAGDKSLHIADPAAWPGLAVRALAAAPAMRRQMLRCTLEEHYAGTLALLCLAARAAGPHLKRAEPAAPPAPTPPAPTPVQVHVELALPAGPLPVAIVAQPATRAVQTVTRDERDEIVETVTVTTPAAA